jgi:hypothetical protein
VTVFSTLQLLMLLELVTTLFALAYYGLSVHRPDEMVGVGTRLDALYFTVSILATVGLGDIHPEGQLARAVATVHIAFDVAFIALFARLLSVAAKQE